MSIKKIVELAFAALMIFFVFGGFVGVLSYLWEFLGWSSDSLLWVAGFLGLWVLVGLFATFSKNKYHDEY